MSHHGFRSRQSSYDKWTIIKGTACLLCYAFKLQDVVIMDSEVDKHRQTLKFVTLFPLTPFNWSPKDGHSFSTANQIYPPMSMTDIVPHHQRAAL